MKILFEIPHVKLVILEDRICLIVEDTEVNDFVEEFLSENFGIISNDVEVDNLSNIDQYYNFFENVEVENLIGMLRKIDAVEVENVYRINN